MVNFIGVFSQTDTGFVKEGPHNFLAVPINPDNLPGAAVEEIAGADNNPDRLATPMAQAQVFFSLTKRLYLNATNQFFPMMGTPGAPAKTSVAITAVDNVNGVGIKTRTYSVAFLYSYSPMRDKLELVSPATTGSYANQGALSISSIFPNAKISCRQGSVENPLPAGDYVVFNLQKMQTDFGLTLSPITADNVQNPSAIIKGDEFLTKVYTGLFDQIVIRRPNQTASAFPAAPGITIAVVNMPPASFDPQNPRFDIQQNDQSRLFITKTFTFQIQLEETIQETINPRITSV